MRLSEQATPPEAGKLDQRLFASSPPPAVAPEVPPPSAKPEPALVAKAPTAPPLNKSAPPAAATERRFNLTDEALYKATFAFTDDELAALEDLKIALKRELDTKVTKNDLMRAALHLLLEDNAATGGPQLRPPQDSPADWLRLIQLDRLAPPSP
jgi:hypothetical protein